MRVVTGDAEGLSGRTIGQAELVTPERAVMRLGFREPTPSLPLHVVPVPVAAGGGRDGHTRIEVTEVVHAADGEREVALRLARSVPTPGRPDELRAGTATAEAARIRLPEWFCTRFPRMCD